MKKRIAFQDKKRISGITARSHVPELKYMKVKSKYLRCAEKKRVYSSYHDMDSLSPRNVVATRKDPVLVIYSLLYNSLD
jgi:hypothetical protein